MQLYLSSGAVSNERRGIPKEQKMSRTGMPLDEARDHGSRPESKIITTRYDWIHVFDPIRFLTTFDSTNKSYYIHECIN